MRYIDYINRLWELNRNNRFKPSERELFFYLLNECNRLYWQMPVYCPTTVICTTLGIDKSTIIRARQGLLQRGLISFTAGVQNSQAPVYTITMDATARATGNATASATITKDKTQINNPNPSAPEMSLELLEERMKNDLSWQQSVLDALANENRSLPPNTILNDYISNFFTYLRLQGYESREERDCRSHFYNKLKKEYIKSDKDEIKHDKYDKRRGCGVSAAKPQDYDAPF